MLTPEHKKKMAAYLQEKLHNHCSGFMFDEETVEEYMQEYIDKHYLAPNYDPAKVTITREQHNALVDVRDTMDKVRIIEMQIGVSGKTNTGWSEERKALNDLSVDKLIRALYYGYNIQQTPEEKVLHYYSTLKSKTNGDDLYQAQMDAISTVLSYMGKEHLVKDKKETF